MKIHDCLQNTPEWLEKRAGIPTASCFSKIITQKTRQLSKSSYPYMCRLVAESILGPLEDASTDFMERGSELEEEAISFYEFTRGVKTIPVGFVTDDDERYGCSPDRWVGEDGGLDVKCPSAGIHVEYMLDGPNAFACQMQGCMWVTGRKWWDVLSYNPELPPAVVRIDRDEDFIADLENAVLQFCDDLDVAKLTIFALIAGTKEESDAA